jgi:predicted Zn-dependent peptidase
LSIEREHRLTTLDSGLRVVSERVPGVRSAALGFWIGAGSAGEDAGEEGVSHLLEHMLFRGSERYGSEEIDQIFDAMGAEINAGTDREATSLYTRVLDRHLERAFDVMSDMLWQPRFGELEAERQVVLEEIAMYEDDPQERVFDLLGGAVFGDHPLGRAVIGSADVVASATRKQLIAFHAGRYLPDRIVIAAAGSVNHDELVAMARAMDVSQQPAQEPLSLAAAPDFKRRVRFLRKDTEQFNFCLGGGGLARDDERRFALRVLEGVLGGSASSRLFQEVRERRGLAYSVFCFSSLYARTGEVGVYLGTRPANLSQAIEVIVNELRRSLSDPATPEELVRSRENLKGRLVLSLESTAARMSHLGASVLYGLPVLSVDELNERIDAVQLADVKELATSLFDPQSLSVAGVGPDEDVFAAAIAPLGGELEVDAVREPTAGAPGAR